MSGMFGIQQSAWPTVPGPLRKSVEWYTPKWVFDELNIRFDLDPAHPHDHETHVPTDRYYTVFDDGLSKEWSGRVWLNPPYSPQTGAWVRRWIAHEGGGVLLVFSRTDASWFQEALGSADAVLFMSGRIDFVPGHENKHKRSRSGAGTALFANGADCVRALSRLTHRGQFMRLRGAG